MKRCPTCGLMLDDSQAFCTNDGTPLVTDKSSFDPQATLIAPPGGVPTAQPPYFGNQQGQQTGWQSPARPTAPPGYMPQSPYEQQAAPRPGKFVPGLIGGVVAGVLCLFADFLPSGPFVIISFFCIVWAIIGGAVAAKLYINRSSTPVQSGEGAVVGMVAGAFGALIYLALDTTIAYAIHGDEITQEALRHHRNLTGGVFFLMSGLFGALIIFGLSVVGGIIGVAMFEKRKAYNTSVPPPPPGYGNPMGGGYR
jgi:predicted lipid-binding transport protein (Tim44 family)